MTDKKTVADINVSRRRVLVRCDFNVPIHDGVITDEKRLTVSLATIKYLLKNDAAVILCSHLGRPKNGFEEKYSLAPVAKRLSQLLGKNVDLARDVVGHDAQKKAASLKPGEIMMLENVRFEIGETKNDPELSEKMASLAEIFVNDAFGSAHRAHCSTAGVASYLPAVSGFLIQRELEVLGKILINPARPFVAILGGGKVSDKIATIESLLDKADTVLIGGGMSYTFYAAMGRNIANSLCENDKLDMARGLLKKANDAKSWMMMPLDHVVSDDFSRDANTKIVDSCGFPDGWMGMDIGPMTIKAYSQIIRGAATVFWNGPVGVYEMQAFAKGTHAIAKAMADCPGVTVIGGGDSAAAASIMGFEDRITHVSTGGGASLEFLEGRVLPGIACLSDK
jgi:phosphoglycerate kinase